MISYREWQEYRHCTRKVPYKTKEAALENTKRYSRKHLRPYKCIYHNHWHLTKIAQPKSNLEKK